MSFTCSICQFLIQPGCVTTAICWDNLLQNIILHKPAGNQTESVQLTAGPAQLPDLAVTLHLKQPALGNQPDSLNEN